MLQHGTEIHTSASARHTYTHLIYSTADRYTPQLQQGAQVHISASARYTD